ncbi:KH domain-containing protein [Pseudodesulfovibrio sp. JC047]|uniref:Jag family protein n=1 Tax=Pseudodesulfovibrio sp. JC047 TaxID=2683199 RepID=UPI0013D2454B|nr:protein jag [Pseudodesulfovibrio sp. JC047]NDV20736.1 KH domain-containing protein [Pseudodesulfovibrio sp. JC047]
MSDFKEFQGKDLDEAIESACDYFNLKRDRLEIEILAGGSSGIFGIMGVKKAKVHARPRAQVNTTDILNDDKTAQPKEKTQQKTKTKPAPKAKNKPAAKPKSKPAPKPKKTPVAPAETNEPNGNLIKEEIFNDVNGNVAPSEEAPRPARKPRERKPRQAAPRERKPREKQRDTKPRPQREERPRANMADFDPTVLEAAVNEVMVKLLEPIVGETTINITIETDRVKVFIDDDDNSGLIIGREGQTLSSIQYLVNRLVSRQMEASVRIQVDTGDYRERQDDKLRQIAWHLAEKAGNLGRTQSTKPLSSYHRRVVHLALQENETVFTRSKGDGPMKRVLIVPKNRKNGSYARD